MIVIICIQIQQRNFRVVECMARADQPLAEDQWLLDGQVVLLGPDRRAEFRRSCAPSGQIDPPRQREAQDHRRPAGTVQVTPAVIWASGQNSDR